MNLSEQLETIRTKVSTQLKAGANSEELRQQILGRKGELTLILRGLSSLPLDERVQAGSLANRIKKDIEELLSSATNEQSSSAIEFDPTVPAYSNTSGTIHPISSLIYELVRIFQDLSFEVVEGNEIVSDKENFESLNIHQDHPARDSHDTFYIKETTLLRTHTSSAQVSEMERRMKAGEMPIRIIVPGKTYRSDSDATHSPMFHQLEGVMVDTQTTFADLKGILDYVAKRLFGDKVETRFRTHFFPFTEPSAEIDIRWKNASGQGKHTEWIEWLGCGMIHPKVLEHAGINPRIYQGWAFGGGIERPVMIRQQVPDLRKFFENSVDFLDQFPDSI